MPILYVDNFRGFNKTFLHLVDVNFFVGENSTGKTSLIKLIGILSSRDFWNYQEFGNERNELGEFAEIAGNSILSKNEHFDVAFFEEKENKEEFVAIRLKFIEFDSKPSIKEIKLINGNLELQISIQGIFAKFRIKNCQGFSTEETTSNHSRFKQWIQSLDLSKLPYQSVEFKGKGIDSLLREINQAIHRSDEIITSKPFEVPSFFANCAWFSPIRDNPKKTYDNPTFIFDSQGRHSPYILRKYLIDDPVSQGILAKFGFDSGLYDEIAIKELDKSLQTEPFQLSFKLNGQERNITNLGYGVSQIFPMIVEVIARFTPTWFAIQQPEIHLHPRAQASFGDLIFKSCIEDNHKFIIETHSDFIIDRYRIRLNKFLRSTGKSADSKAQIIFFSHSDNGNRLTAISINSDGSYSDDQPDEFRDFFIREQLDLINI